MSPGRDHPSVVPSLPPSVEQAYRTKCVQLRRRMQEVETVNDEFRLRKLRLARGIRKMRLERAILLDQLGKRMHKKGSGDYEDDTEDSADSPIMPQERPMRVKRSHRRPDSSVLQQSSSSRLPPMSLVDSAGMRTDTIGGQGLDPYIGGDDPTAKDEEMADSKPHGDTAVMSNIQHACAPSQSMEYEPGSNNTTAESQMDTTDEMIKH